MSESETISKKKPNWAGADVVFERKVQFFFLGILFVALYCTYLFVNETLKIRAWNEANFFPPPAGGWP